MTAVFDLGTMLSVNNDTKVQLIPCTELVPYHNHKFSLYSGERLDDMIESIRKNGILTPLVLPTMVDNTNISKNALRTLTECFTDTMLNTVIHKSVEAAKSSESGVALCKTRNRLGEEYKWLASEVVRR